MTEQTACRLDHESLTSYVVKMSFRYAGFWVRAIAEWIDFAILALVSTAFELAGLGALFWLRSDRSAGFADAFDPAALQLSISIVFALCAFAYFTIAHYRPGFTVGMRVFGLRVASSDGAPITLTQSLRRTAASLVSIALLGAGYWLAAFHPQRQTLHDLIAGTIVIA